MAGESHDRMIGLGSCRSVAGPRRRTEPTRAGRNCDGTATETVHIDGVVLTYRHLDVIDRQPLLSAGVTGARLERLTLRDGRILIAKSVDARADWLMRATGDDGRIFRLWRDGVLEHLPEGIDAAVEWVEPAPEGCTVMMRDVSATLPPAGHLVSRARMRQVLAAAARLHAQFEGDHRDGLCPIVERLGYLSPPAVRAIRDHPFRNDVLRGWERFVDLAPADVGSAVLQISERPGRLAAALAGFPETLLHGDLKVANVGFRGDDVVLLDWGTLTGMGPAALDFAWHLAVNAAAVAASPDELYADVVEALRPEDREALPLALLGQLAVLGWSKGLGATADDAATRQQEAAGLAWWCARAAEALAAWSPPSNLRQ